MIKNMISNTLGNLRRSGSFTCAFDGVKVACF